MVEFTFIFIIVDTLLKIVKGNFGFENKILPYFIMYINIFLSIISIVILIQVKYKAIVKFRIIIKNDKLNFYLNFYNIFISIIIILYIILAFNLDKFIIYIK